MYGACRLTSRKVGVRKAPLSASIFVTLKRPVSFSEFVSEFQPTPRLWNLPSVKFSPTWQVAHRALPKNSWSPFFTSGDTADSSLPLFHLSQGELPLILV